MCLYYIAASTTARGRVGCQMRMRRLGRAWLFLEQDWLHSSAELERESHVSKEGEEGIVDVLAYYLLRKLDLLCWEFGDWESVCCD